MGTQSSQCTMYYIKYCKCLANSIFVQILQRFPVYTVHHLHGETIDLAAPIGAQYTEVKVRLQPAGDTDDWFWRVRENRVEYHSEYRGPFMNI